MKGQTAVEYLMTYGWAILIILIVAGVLAYYGIFNPSGFLGCSVGGFTNVAILTPWSLGADGTFTATLENRVGTPMVLNKVSIWSSTDATKNDSAELAISFSTAQKQIVSTSAMSGITGTKGDTFSYNIALQYTTDNGAHNFTSTGTANCKFG